MISASSVISAGAKIGKNVSIGAFSVVGERVSLGDNVALHAHAVVTGNTHIAAGTTIHSFAVLGGDPQAYKADGSMGTCSRVNDDCKLEVGPNCVFREHCTVNSGSLLGHKLTRIGANCLMLAGVHIGHDCRVHNNVVISNGSMLAGHVCVGTGATLGGQVAVRQFVNIGKMAMIGGSSAVDRHVPPFALVAGNRSMPRGVNLVGLRRRGVSLARIRSLQRAFGLLRHVPQRSFQEHVRSVAAAEPDDLVQELCSFLLDSEEDSEGEPLYMWERVQQKLGHVL